MNALLLMLLVACSGSQKGGAAQREDCKLDPQVQHACMDRGTGYTYTSDPDRTCGGGNPPSPEEQAQRERANAATPCVCLSDAELAERYEACKNMP
jgi:hypothetical protein